ncbi:unnamed protein product [Arabidopsis lyrata]|uniref:Predicted protein n=1 Tax=Arabidopsis lyrata subsp. lyrata TaxID=81972 RepID=D7KJ79_ARALL|nr:predicted protein [Arabidopsis lyrata subsp. lyrata]CAH8254224.1 unnamed protein product [Arabidopsis lyrata]
MAFSIVKLVNLKRKKWQSKLQNTKKQVLGRCLANFSRLLSFRKKQERNGKNPRCSKTTLAVVVHPISSAIQEDLVEDICKKQERSGKSPSYSETTLPVELPEDLVEEILHRLPVKYLVRLKSVSKVWKSLIESSHLAEKHLRLLEKKYGVKEMKITVKWSTSKSICIKFFSRRSGMDSNSEGLLRVPGSCNGLVCVYELDLVYIYLLNPMTGVTRTLTPPRGTKLSVGFGSDIVTGTYKVVVLYGFDRVGTVVFDLSTSKWRRRYKTAGPMPLSCIPTPERNPVFILVMDLHTEKFRTLSQPNDMDDVDVSSGYIYMWSLEDRLCVSNFRQGLHSYVWVLVQDELSERTRFNLLGHVLPPLSLDSAWFSQTLVSPYQSSSSTCIGSRQRQNRTSALCQ